MLHGLGPHRAIDQLRKDDVPWLFVLVRGAEEWLLSFYDHVICYITATGPTDHLVIEARDRDEPLDFHDPEVLRYRADEVLTALLNEDYAGVLDL